MHCPADVGIGGRHLAHDLPILVEAIEAETGGLALDPPRVVLESSWGHGMGPRRLRTQEPLVSGLLPTRAMPIAE
jgi:hypothetical protein